MLKISARELAVTAVIVSVGVILLDASTVPSEGEYQYFFERLGFHPKKQVSGQILQAIFGITLGVTALIWGYLAERNAKMMNNQK